MKNIKNIYVIILLLIGRIDFFSQQIDNELLHQKIKAIARANQSVYLILDDKAVKMDINKIYEEYYKTIYQDTSIVNPNTILQTNQIEIIPIIKLSNLFTSYKVFTEDIYLYSLFEHDSTGILSTKPKIYNIFRECGFIYHE